MPNTVPDQQPALASNRVHVAAGIIVNSYGEILLAKRPDHTHQGGLWEFPGGKLDAGESVEQALIRELHEELGIHIHRCEPFMQVEHDYADKQVLLDFWRVTGFAGEPKGAEGQMIVWVSLQDLPDYSFPAANRPVVEHLLATM